MREKSAGKYRVRGRRATSDTHQFLPFAAQELERVASPKGRMGPIGYSLYLKGDSRQDA